MRKNKLFLIMIIISLLYALWGITSFNALNYIMTRRLLRIVAVVIVSYCLSISTVYFQVISENHVLTPSILGFDKIYLLFQLCFTVVLGKVIPSTLNLIISVVIMIPITSFIYTWLLKKLKQNISLMLLLGIVGGMLIQSVISSIGLVLDPNEYSIFQSYSIASLNDISISRVAVVIGILIPTLMFKRHLDCRIDVMALGKSWALNLGLDTKVFQKHSLFIISSCSSLATVLIGPNLFLGLVAVTIARGLVKTSSQTDLIKVSTLIGIILLISSQLILENILRFNGSLEFGIAIIGGIIFCISYYKEIV